MGRVHVIGAGLAGLAAAVRLAGHGVAVVLHEAAGHAGGRCRSFHDHQLDRRIDNGNHLMLSGNSAVQTYQETIGAVDTMSGPERAEFPFIDLADGTRWTVRPDRGAIPWSVFRSHRRVPGTHASDYLKAWKLVRAGKTDTLGDCLATEGALWRRFWHPIAVSILNTDPAKASAQLLWAVIAETFGKGEAACRPLIAKQGLSESLIDPAVRYVQNHDGEVRLNDRVRGLSMETGKVVGLTASEEIRLKSDDKVVMALPPTGARGLLPDIDGPDAFQAIVNGHFMVEQALDDHTFMGVVGGTAEWIFVRGDVVSVTVSAADRLAEKPEAEIAQILWADIRRVFDIKSEQPGPYRIIKEKRATFAQTPAQVARRPECETVLKNLFLAGDWTDTDLPATIEGALRSGFHAADKALETIKNVERP
ncbi:MAG: NAD(P)-binding protein [Rhodospirillaceae bacterium]|nr:NAD(P)-binding protein [Rhodospirillaceae bacterium]